MNREIEYRAFEPNAKQCEDAPHLDMRWWDWNELKDGNFCKMVDKHNAGEAFLMQYTGLKDMNGIKIFEGDFIINKHLGSMPYLVVFLRGSFLIKRQYDELLLAHMANEVVVHGNVHDNPELLEVE